MIKYIEDLTYEELKSLIANNSELKHKAYERAMDDAYMFTEEYLMGAPREIDYEFFARGEHFTIKDFTEDVLRWLAKQSDTYGIFSDEVRNSLDRTYELWHDIEYGVLDDDPDYEKYVEEYEGLKDAIEDEFFEAVHSAYDYASYPDDGYVDIVSGYSDEFFEDGDWVDTDTWEIHNIYDEEDEENEGLDYDLDEQLELPID